MGKNHGKNGTVALRKSVPEPHPETGLEHRPMQDLRRQRHAVVRHPEGLHMRPAQAIALVARQFQATAFISQGDRRANAESVLDLMCLGIMPDSEVLLEADGPDADALLEGLCAIIEARTQDFAPNDRNLPPKG